MKQLDSKRLKAYRYRIYPTEEQKEFFAKTFGCVRLIWNLMLNEKLNAYEKKEKIPRNTPAKYKSEYPFLKEVDSLALMNAQRALENAFKNYFKNKKHYKLPKFKRKKNKQSYTTNNVNNNIKIDFENELLYLPKINNGIKIKIHRKFRGRIVSITISKTPSNNYYASILVELENQNDRKNKIKEPKSKVCGIDLGLEHFAVITNDFGTYKIEYPKHLRKAEKRLKRLYRALSRKKKGSKNRKKTKRRLAKQHAYVANIRNDFLHKLSKAIIDENQIVVVEDLKVQDLFKNKHISKPISDSGFGIFLRYLEYKVEWYDRKLIVADRFYPSSTSCNVCGTYHDSDINASVKLYKIGLERSELKPVEKR